MATRIWQTHPDHDVEAALRHLQDALVTWERNTGRQSIMILREEGGFFRRLDNGVPLDSDQDDIPDSMLLARFEQPAPKPEIPDWKGIPAADRKLWFGVATEGMEAPWLGPYGACFVKIWDIKRGDDGEVYYGIGNETRPEDKDIGWVSANAFYSEWPD